MAKDDVFRAVNGEPIFKAVQEPGAPFAQTPAPRRAAKEERANTPAPRSPAPTKPSTKTEGKK